MLCPCPPAGARMPTARHGQRTDEAVLAAVSIRKGIAHRPPAQHGDAGVYHVLQQHILHLLEQGSQRKAGG